MGQNYFALFDPREKQGRAREDVYMKKTKHKTPVYFITGGNLWSDHKLDDWLKNEKKNRW